MNQVIMKKRRLFDFSIPAAVSALLVFPFLFYLLLGRYLYEGKWPFLIAAILLAAAFLYLLYDFVFTAPVLDEDGVHYKGLHIPRSELTVVSEYDARFKEPVYRLRNVTLNYRYMEEAERKANEIRVQATSANTAKLQEYTGSPLAPAKKPKYRWKG